MSRLCSTLLLLLCYIWGYTLIFFVKRQTKNGQNKFPPKSYLINLILTDFTGKHSSSFVKGQIIGMKEAGMTFESIARVVDVPRRTCNTVRDIEIEPPTVEMPKSYFCFLSYALCLYG